MTIALVQMVLAAIVLYACFCRLVYTNRATFRSLRWSIWYKAICAFLAMVAPIWPFIHPDRVPWDPWTTPEWVWLMLLVSVAVAQIVQARLFWVHGVPVAPITHARGVDL